MSALQEQLQATLGDAYRLDGELGGGGMSHVFVAHETALGRKVVIKVLLPELAAGVSIDRFRREIQLAAQLQHPHIVPLLSAGESEGLPYFIMPFVSGESLRARVMRSGELPIAESVRILRDVVSALAYAHSFGVVHRDIKPDNVLISGGVAVVTDFGVAKAVSASSGDPAATALTSRGLALGTPAYMAPEQASGDANVDHRADIYSLGVMAYEMLAGRAPFLGRSTQATLAAHVLEMPDPVDRLRPAVSPVLAALVMSCLAKRPADRPQSASEVLHALDSITTPGGGTIPTTVVSTPAISARRPGRGRAIAMAAGVGAAAVAAVVLWVRHESRASAEAPAGIAATLPETLGAAPKAPTPAAVEAPAPPPVETPRPARTPVSPREGVKGNKAAAAGAASERTHRRPPADSVRPEAQAVVPAPMPEDSAAVAGAPANAADSTAPAPAPAPAPPTPSPPSPTPPPTARDTRPAIQDVTEVIAEYARAVESESVENLQRVYPGMTAEQQQGWKQFFGTVREVKSQLNIRQADVSGDVGSVLVTGLYTYVNGSTHRTEEQQVSFHAMLRRTGGTWRIVEVR